MGLLVPLPPPRDEAECMAQIAILERRIKSRAIAALVMWLGFAAFLILFAAFARADSLTWVGSPGIYRVHWGIEGMANFPLGNTRDVSTTSVDLSTLNLSPGSRYWFVVTLPTTNLVYVALYADGTQPAPLMDHAPTVAYFLAAYDVAGVVRSQAVRYVAGTASPYGPPVEIEILHQP